MSSDIKAIAVRVLEEIFPADDETALAEVISEKFVNHEAPPGTPPGTAGITMFMHMLAKAFTDQRWTMNQVLAEGDRVVMYCTHSGRHIGDFFDLPATGRRFSYNQIHIVRIVDGKAVEHWAVRDDSTCMRQLTGQLPEPE